MRDPKASAGLVSAFPATLRDDVLAALAEVPAGPHSPHIAGAEPVRVGEELVTIPYRIYTAPLTSTALAKLPPLHQTIVACIYTRHHDGRVREAAVHPVMTSDAPWTAPFVVRLLGEYVVEIMIAIEAHADALSEPRFARFIAHNPDFFALTWRRMISHWNERYRRSYRDLSDYPGARVLARLARAAGTSRRAALRRRRSQGA